MDFYDILDFLYFLICFIAAGVYTAYINSEKGNPEYWERKPFSSDIRWKDASYFKVVVVFLFWPFVLPTMYIYNKALNRFKNKK